MIFITLIRWRQKPTKELIAQSSKILQQGIKEGGKIIGVYWTLGRYDAVVIAENPDEKAVMRNHIRAADLYSTETLIAVTREEALKLIE